MVNKDVYCPQVQFDSFYLKVIYYSTMRGMITDTTFLQIKNKMTKISTVN